MSWVRITWGHTRQIKRFQFSPPIFELGLIAVQTNFWNFRAWLYCGTNWFLKFPSLTLLRCKLNISIYELGLIAILIAVQNDFPNFRARPYCGANRLGLIAVHQCVLYLLVELQIKSRNKVSVFISLGANSDWSVVIENFSGWHAWVHKGRR